MGTAPITAEEIQRALARIEEVDARLNAFVEVRDEGSITTRTDGSLAGMTMAIKDCFFHAGRTPTMGSHVHPEPASGTAEVIRCLENAGAAIVGYTNLHEWALGGTSSVTATGPIRNPWDPSRLAGGSSGGSAAALAAGCVDGSLGTDTGGSIRIPAAWSGVVGLKPSRGAVSMSGYVLDGAPTDHIGPMARNVGDVARLFEVLTGTRSTQPAPSALRVGIARGAPFDDVQPEVAEAFQSATDALAPLVASIAHVTIEGFVEQRWANVTLFIGNAARVLARDLERRPGSFQPMTLERLRWGSTRSAQDIEAARAVRAHGEAVWSAMFEDIDVLLTPTVPTVAPSVDDTHVLLPSGAIPTNDSTGVFTGPMNLVGTPSLSVPCGPEDELPVGLALTAERGQEGSLFALGRAFEDATDRRWVDRVASL